MKKRMICMLLAIVMLIGLLPVAVFADSVQGTITENTVWNDGDVISSAVTISGGTQSSPVMITVNGTVTVNAAIAITGHVCITGGGTLQRGTGGFAMLKVNNGGSLTTYNVTIDGNAMVGSYNRGIEVASGGSLVINEGTVLRNHTPEGSNGSVLQVFGSVVMNGGIIENNRNDKYGNIYLRDGATFTMNGGIVRNNTLRLTSTNQYGGGAFYVRDATFTMNGGSISGHHINAWGGAIYCTSYAKVYLNGGVITDNSAYQNRGDSVFYSSQHNNDGELHLGGNPYVANSVYLDDTNGTKKPYITSVIKQPITLMLPTDEEGRVVAVGVGNYTLTEADMSKITLMTPGDTQYYAKLDVQNNQLLMTNTDPGYPKVFYVSYHGNGGTGTTEDNTAYASGAQAVIKVNAFARTDYAFTGWNTKADGSGTTYMVGESIPVTNDVVLYAQWTNVPHSHSYTYTAGGNVITEFCTCGHQKKATLTAPTGTIIYDGAEKKSATVTYSDGWLGGELTVSYANNINAGTATASIQKGNAIATVNFIISKADQSAPTGLTKTDETISKKADGKISGLAGNIEYRKEGENAYTAVNSSTLENLSAGKYYVRYAGDGNHNPSADVEIALAEGRKLLVTYKVDGEIFDTVEVSYGDNADAPQLPGKEGYTGTWDVDGTNIIADTAINAVYTINKYIVTYKADGKVVKTVEVEYGTDAIAPEIPAKAGHTAAWDKDGKNITADTEINAVYTINKYTVTYKADGKVVKTVEVEHGKDATAPEIPAKEGYNETAPKWDKDGKNITADTEINAVYTKNQPGEYADVTPDTNVGGGKVAEEIEEMKEKVPFTQEEETQIEYGADVEVWLEIKDISDSVSSEEKAKVEEKLGDADVALYLDIAMFKQVGENEASRLTQLSDKVQITFKLDDSYINTDKDVTRTYSIIHVHDGKAEVITPMFDANAKTLSFQTDRFSTYALVYTDVVNTPPAETPATGDSFQPAFWIACMTLSIFGNAVLLLDAKRRHAR